MIKGSSYLQDWKDNAFDILRLQYSKDEISDKNLKAYLDKQIEEKLDDKQLILVNNYTNKCSKMKILDLIEVIRSHNLICSGGGCLFIQHGERRNILIEFITFIKASRNDAKKRRKKYEKNTDEWEAEDRAQLGWKLIINSLYGCLGYPGFILFNIFLAEAITNQGKQIITSAINAVENFLGNAMYMEDENEVYHVINTIDKEFFIKTKGKLTTDALAMFEGNIDFKKLPEIVTKRYLDHCIFKYDNDFVSKLLDLFSNMSTDELVLMYYKNNFMEFNRLPFMKAKFKKIIIMNGPLSFCEMWCYKDDDCRNFITEMWDLYEFFVLYNYPVYDRVRKAMYTDKTKSLYTDTDSVFISLDEVIKFIENEIFDSIEESNMTKENLTFTAANITLTFANMMIDKAMKTLCASINITPEHAKLLRMKNEFYLSRILFTNVKKRYISLSILQEGQLLNNGKGDSEIKGFDFIKSGTKPFVKNFYTKICLDEILYPEEIKPIRVYKKVLELKHLMENTIKDGNMEFFKQANVKKPEHYKNPYSTQGVCAIMLWNALCPDNMLDFPIDVNIVPIKALTYKKPPKPKEGEQITIIKKVKDPLEYKNIADYAEKYPDAYKRLCKTFYNNPQLDIRYMNLTSIAIPKNLDYTLPDYITELFDIKTVIDDTIRLFIPVMNVLGIQSLSPTSQVEHLTNLVSL